MFGTVSNSENTELSGSERIVPEPDDVIFHVLYSVFFGSPTDHFHDDENFASGTSSLWTERFANPDLEPEQTVALNYEMQCDPGSRTWVLRQNSITPRGSPSYPIDYEFDMLELSPCLGVTRVCTNRAAATIRADGAPGEASTSAALGPSESTFSCSMTDFDGYGLRDLDVEFTDPNWPQAGQPCTPGETVPGAHLLPYTLLIGLGCITPDQMQGAGLGVLGSTADLCMNNWTAPSAMEPIISQPGGEPGQELPTFCNLEETCGDSVCDSPCEDAQFCPADCQPTSSTSDFCATQGGLQWQGEVCTCAGVVDQVTLCQNGAKYDNVTDVSCTPDPKDCTDNNGGNGNDGGDGGQCLCLCTKYNYQLYPPACEQYRDCNGNSCTP